MTQTTDCPKCGGTGKINGFRHVHDGICFKCNGTGKVLGSAKPTASPQYVQIWTAEEAGFCAEISTLQGNGMFKVVDGKEVVTGPKGGTVDFKKYFQPRVNAEGEVWSWMARLGETPYTIFND